ncbi:MAG: group II intron reverse transcriptase/maturase [Deltaproteobacteria bacterium RIFCSPLOWO2_12_FULL_60_19]|nr:MAG: group II intron reverse transcriptase/maturase [Deltaproteobacteria bacterium RIFCSPLOWO2_12_FULL_60_19]
MTRGDADRRAEKLESHPKGSRRNRREQGLGASRVTARREHSGPEVEQLLEAVVERENMWSALKRVERNSGAAGVDKMTVAQLRPNLREHWPRIKEELLAGEYQPQPVLKVEIPKPGGQGMRMLGIPTVIDRLIQQALHQVLSPLFEPSFSESSYGFRPNRSAQQAVLKAREYVRAGRRWVVDIDLEKFFDRVNHDVLMSRLARRIKDKGVLRLIRRYLQAGMMSNGLATVRREGTPQGGPLSPLLSNILLDELDKELERRGHKFCRYADDCNIYVRSRSAGERVMKSITSFLERRLRLQVNAEKSAVARPWERKFLGYSLTWHRESRLKVAASSVQRLKEKLREIFRRARGRNVGKLIEAELTPLLRGWMSYFRLAEVKGIFEELDGWIRRKLRGLIWRQWKRALTRTKGLMRRGLDEVQARRSALNGRGPWWNAGASHMHAAFSKSYFDRCGLLSLLDQRLRFGWTS